MEKFQAQEKCEVFLFAVIGFTSPWGDIEVEKKAVHGYKNSGVRIENYWGYQNVRCPTKIYLVWDFVCGETRLVIEMETEADRGRNIIHLSLFDTS